MRTPYVVTAFFALLAESGCSLATTDSTQLQGNTCSADSACGPLGQCGSVNGSKACVAKTSDVGKVILDVSPAADSNGNVVSHVFPDVINLSGDLPKGAAANINLAIPPNVTFQGELIPGKVIATCTATDGSVPAQVELHSVPAYAGFSQTYTTTAQLVGGKYLYSLTVPPGIYDVYISETASFQDLVAKTQACNALSLPPRLVSQIDLTKNVNFTSGTDTLQHAKLTLKLPTQSVEGWQVEIVDKKYGLLVSDSMVLPDQNGATQLAIMGGVAGSDPQGLRFYYAPNESLRVRSKDGKLIILWDLSGLSVPASPATIDLTDLLANQIALGANVVDGNAQGVAASVTIQSTHLTGSTPASFRELTQTDGQGVFHVSLVPGSYAVSVSPNSDETLASLQATWDVMPGTLGYGTSFVLPARPMVKGQVTTMTGAPLVSVPVVVAPHAASAVSYFEGLTLSSMTSVSRAGNVTTDDSGSFSFLVDPSPVDFSVRPTAASRFSWLVQEHLTIDPVTMPVHDFKTLAVPAPAIVTGTVSSPDGIVPSAVVRAYVATGDTPMTSGALPTVVQIGETVTDSAGHFELPLPSSLTTTQ